MGCELRCHIDGVRGSIILPFGLGETLCVLEAALAPAGYSLLADSFKKERLVRATSIFALGAMIGAGIAFLVGGMVMDYAANAPTAPFGLDGLQPWQFTFIVIGLPGFLVAILVMMIKEPPRQGMGKAVPLTFRAAFAYLWERRRDYAPLYFAATLMAVLSYGGLTWFATHLIRTYGLTPGQVGLVLGFCHLVGPILGTFLGAGMTERFMARGHRDAPLRTIMIIALFAALTYVAPLMPTLGLTAAVWFVSVIFQNAYYGNVLATLQMITPNQLRATNSAMLTLVVSMGGLGFGSAMIGGISDLFFAQNPRGIGYAMTIVGVTFGLLASLVAARGRASLTSAMERFDRDNT